MDQRFINERTEQVDLTSEEDAHLSDHPFDYISYVSFREAWTEVKDGFYVWLAFMVLAVIISFLCWGGGKLFEGIAGGTTLPKLSGSTWFAIIYCAVTWFGRGERINFRIPKFGFGTWFVATFCVLVGSILVAQIATWLFIGYFYTLFPLFRVIDKLNVKGYGKFRGMKNPAQVQDGIA